MTLVDGTAGQRVLATEDYANYIGDYQLKYIRFTKKNTKAEVYNYCHTVLKGTSSYSKSVGCIGFIDKGNVINEILKITDNGDSNIDFYDITNNLTLVAYSTQTSEYLEGDLTLLFIVP